MMAIHVAPPASAGSNGELSLGGSLIQPSLSSVLSSVLDSFGRKQANVKGKGKGKGKGREGEQFWWSGLPHGTAFPPEFENPEYPSNINFFNRFVITEEPQAEKLSSITFTLHKSQNGPVALVGVEQFVQHVKMVEGYYRSHGDKREKRKDMPNTTFKEMWKNLERPPSMQAELRAEYRAVDGDDVMPAELQDRYMLDPFGNVISDDAVNGSICYANIEHVFPHSLGGLSKSGNLVPCCHYANGSKGDTLMPFVVKYVQPRQPGSSTGQRGSGAGYRVIDNYILALESIEPRQPKRPGKATKGQAVRKAYRLQPLIKMLQFPMFLELWRFMKSKMHEVSKTPEECTHKAMQQLHTLLCTPWPHLDNKPKKATYTSKGKKKHGLLDQGMIGLMQKYNETVGKYSSLQSVLGPQGQGEQQSSEPPSDEESDDGSEGYGDETEAADGKDVLVGLPVSASYRLEHLLYGHVTRVPPSLMNQMSSMLDVYVNKNSVLEEEVDILSQALVEVKAARGIETGHTDTRPSTILRLDALLKERSSTVSNLLAELAELRHALQAVKEGPVEGASINALIGELQHREADIAALQTQLASQTNTVPARHWPAASNSATANNWPAPHPLYGWPWQYKPALPPLNPPPYGFYEHDGGYRPYNPIRPYLDPPPQPLMAEGYVGHSYKQSTGPVSHGYEQHPVPRLYFPPLPTQQVIDNYARYNFYPQPPLPPPSGWMRKIFGSCFGGEGQGGKVQVIPIARQPKMAWT